MQNGDEALPSIIPAGRCQLVIYFDQILHTYTYQQPFLMDEALMSISRAGRGQLVKMLITLEPHGIC